jgi:cytochrome c-type biogenesis protein CcmF
MNIEYVGEHLVWGYIGHLFIVLSFAGAFLSALSYFFAETQTDSKPEWKKLGRLGFRIHSAGVLGIIAVLFFLLFNHYFEYQYVWQHSNTAMPMQYILSCFWEGQEGSFLLWTFWNMVLGNILIRVSRDWEFSTMTIVALVQVFLASMLLGIYIGDAHIGSNPFILLREHPDYMNLPFVKQATYLAKLDGRGLNPLLQNYWMTIHPPTLFLGFASTLFPFAYAIAGIWRKQYFEWIKPALTWTFFGVCILGTGVLMGGAWAYEALSFGGFWAWDPVENASLVPWLTLVAGGHVMLINQKKGQSVVTAIFLIILSFILILYSTFLTRSGILGESSVHAFTDLGMSGQLLIYLLFFIWLPSAIALDKGKPRLIWISLSVALVLWSFIFEFSKLITTLFLIASVIITLRTILSHLKKSELGDMAPGDGPKEEELSSREFWMFIGALVLLIAAFQITFTTSTPVINKFLSGHLAEFFAWCNQKMPSDVFQKLSEAKMAAPKDVIGHYNAWQIPFAGVIGIILAFGQFLKYRKTPVPEFFSRIAFSLISSVILTIILALALKLDQAPLVFLLFSALFATLANLDFWLRILKGKLKHAGPSIAHVGVGLILLGALISAGKKEYISKNESSFDLGKDFPNKENVLLALNDTVKMGDYLVSYRGDSSAGINIYYNVDYLKKDENGKLSKEFTLHPLIQTNPRMGNVAEPATKHYLHKDIFTHVTYAKLEDPKEQSNGGWKEAEVYKLRVADTVFTSNSMVILQQIDRNIDPVQFKLQPGDIAVGARLKVLSVSSSEHNVMPVFVLRGNTSFSLDTTLEAMGLQFSFTKIDPEKESFEFKIREKTSNAGEFIILKAIVFPGINILWMGSILMAIGTAFSVWQRIRKNRTREIA